MTNSQRFAFIDCIVDALAVYLPDACPSVHYFIAAQFALESNFGSSNLARLHHNLCGMKVPLTRLSLNIASGGFAHYSDSNLCIIDYVLWLQYNRFSISTVRNLELFKLKLQTCGYCPEKDYIDRISNLYLSLSNLQSKS